MRLVLICSIAWFFSTAGGTIGPFDNEQACNEARLEYRGWAWKSKCWHYGGKLDNRGQPAKDQP